MEEIKKERETKLVNGLLGLLSVGCLALAGWSVANDGIRAGVDSLFLIIICLLLALVFAINPLIWAYENGYISNPFDVQDNVVEDEHAHGDRQNVWIWVALLALTAIEVFLAYIHIEQTLMLIILMGLSIIKAALIIAYFMHMKFEKLTFILTIVPILVILLCLFAIFFPDSMRLRDNKPYAAPAAAEQTHQGQ